MLDNRELIADRVEVLWKTFDDNQKAAVNAILDRWYSARDNSFVLPVIDGPPGTGKTTVAAVAIARYLLENPREQVLYMCYTNFAADCALRILNEKLGFSENQAIRIPANPRERSPGVFGFSDLEDLSGHERRMLESCPVLICTLHRASKAANLRRRGTKVIIDEFSQVNVPMFFATVERVKYLDPEGYALLGDPKQLPMVTTQPILYQNICSFILGKKQDYEPHNLILQHRMHEEICAAVNSLRRALGTYDIETSPRVRDRKLTSPQFGFQWNDSVASDPVLREILDPDKPFVIINTDNLNAHEEVCYRGSIKNTAEARLAATIAKAFYESYQTVDGTRLHPTILSPYSAQVVEISRYLPPHLQDKCTTIFRAQGREYPCVIISFVRNNPNKFIGFLDEPQLRAQTYVACSRAQAKLVVLLSFRTFLNAGHADFDYLCNTSSAHRVDAC
ncbi:MAG: AAA domain-containing protein [Candidatus Bathyarchaeia archaeon]